MEQGNMPLTKERNASPVLVESKEQPSEAFLTICNELDPAMETDFINRAWKQFDTVGQQCVLEGNEMAWMACAVYLSMWQSAPLGQELHHGYALSSLIRICKISVLEFFEKLTKWVEMVSCPRRLQEQVSRIQSCLAVSAVVYKKLLPIFRRIFAPPSILRSESELGCRDLFELLWTFFIAMKKQFANVDLMNSFHLLLCTVDFIFQDVRRLNMGYLLNRDFLSSLTGDDESILETLCRTFDGVVLDAKHFRTHWWLPRVRKMANEQTVIVNSDLQEFVANASANLKALNEVYEDAMIKKGEMDERMFIPKDIGMVFDEAFDATAVEQLRRSELDESWAVDAELLLRMSTQSCLERLNEQRGQPTPLSGKSYVISGDQYCPLTPLSASMYNASKLEQLIRDDWRVPGSELERIMAQCGDNPSAFVANCVRLMGDKLENAVASEKEVRGPSYDNLFTEMISVRRANTEALFYRLLEKIALAERQRMPAHEIPDLSVVLNKEELLKSVYACALQLVLFTYDSEREFPWSIEVLRIYPVHFYKVIELVIRAEPELSREMVKHLNKVEERVLEELAWSLDSPLWQTLARRADGVPSSQSVSLNVIESYSSRTQSAYGLSQRYSVTPTKFQPVMGVAKRRLEFDDDDMGPSQSAKRMAVDSDCTGSTSATTLFFRKVYYLAAVRLQDLCERVRLDERGRQRVWTLFEHVLRTETSLMTGRHLDQNLMCCLYVVAKIGKQDVSFHNIMYHYRHQPQASSRVYRRVLIDHTASPTVLSDDNASRDSVSSNSGGKFRSGSTLPVPGMGSAPPTPEPQNLDYTDLIKYYNRVFVSRVEYFVKKLQPGLVDLKESGVSLLSMPNVRCHMLSPRRAVGEHVSVLPMPVLPASPARPLRYSFNRSPSKDLRSINTMVHNSGRSIAYAVSSYQPYAYRSGQFATRTYI